MPENFLTVQDILNRLFNQSTGNLKTEGGGGGGASTIANGADVAEGNTADAAIVTDAAGTLSGKMRGLIKWAFERMPASLGQKTKDNSFPVTIASNQDALSVTPAATESHLGAVGGNTACVDVSVVMSTHANYVANDFVGTDNDALTFSNVARVNGGTGIIVGAILVDKALQSISGELWLFDSEPSPPADSAAWTISDDDAAKVIGVIPFSTYYASAANSVSPVGNLSIAFQAGVASRNIFGCFVTRGAPTYASGDLVIRLRVMQD